MECQEISDCVADAVEALRIRDSKQSVESLRTLALADPAGVFASLFGLIVDLADRWGADPLPVEDALGNRGVAGIVEAIRANDLAALLATAGGDFGTSVTRLAATAAALTR